MNGALLYHLDETCPKEISFLEGSMDSLVEITIQQ